MNKDYTFLFFLILSNGPIANQRHCVREAEITQFDTFSDDGGSLIEFPTL